MPSVPSDRGLTVAVTGPTGGIGLALLRALDRARGIAEVRGMARRPFDPAALGLRRIVYQQGDVLDRGAVNRLVEGADVVVHLAFIIFGGLQESREVNLTGSRNVFEATIAAGAARLAYASSVAAYGFGEQGAPLTEDLPPRGTDAHYYSAQKAELEGLLGSLLPAGRTEAYIFRPCIVGGPDALLLVENLPYLTMSKRLPTGVRRLFDLVPILRPVLPDNGVAFQLVHQDDVAQALLAAVAGRGEPGIYNLAGEGTVTLSDLARELGWYAVPVPELAVDATAGVVARLPFLPAEAQWIEALRRPVIMATAKARRVLAWHPRHDAAETLVQIVAAAREDSRARLAGPDSGPAS